MEAHNAKTHLVQPNFSRGDYVLRAEPKRVLHKLTLIWKGPYQVDKVFDNLTLRVNSLINEAQFITHVTRTRLYKDALLQLVEDLQAAAHCKKAPSNLSSTSSASSQRKELPARVSC
jgi:hypothetical protein